ncbi:hypothetical protein HAX54_011572, partial [Datura stramonium]|nr:hypothetical protein [Datura stramonium]
MAKGGKRGRGRPRKETIASLGSSSRATTSVQSGGQNNIQGKIIPNQLGTAN